MATKAAVVKALAVLASNFAGDVTPERVATWRAALDEVPDEALGVAVAHVVKSYTGPFLPPVAVIRAACQANGTPPDIEDIVRQIGTLGSYDPRTGWTAPRVQAVREALGDAIASAYGLIGGGARLFSGNETTHAIALRDFSENLTDMVETTGAALLPPGTPLKQISTAGR